MPRRLGHGKTRTERTAARLTIEALRLAGADLLRAREDAGLSRVAVAREANVSPTQVRRIESGVGQPSVERLNRVAVALGGRISVRFYPETRPVIRDHLQAAMSDAVLRSLDPRWRRHLEVAVYRPVRGVIDLVLADVDAACVVATEIHSDVRRVEQQVRWANEKKDAFESTDLYRLIADAGGGSPLRVSRLLLLRSTQHTRQIAIEYAELLATAYPARAEAAVAALTSADHSWPGDALVWMRVAGRSATLLSQPPRGVSVGR